MTAATTGETHSCLPVLVSSRSKDSRHRNSSDHLGNIRLSQLFPPIISSLRGFEFFDRSARESGPRWPHETMPATNRAIVEGWYERRFGFVMLEALDCQVIAATVRKSRRVTGIGALGRHEYHVTPGGPSW